MQMDVEFIHSFPTYLLMRIHSVGSLRFPVTSNTWRKVIYQWIWFLIYFPFLRLVRSRWLQGLSFIFLAPACQPQISFFTARVDGESRHHQLHRTTDDFPFFFLLQRQQQPTTEQLVYQMCKYMCIRKYAQREKQFIFLYHPRALLLLCPTRSPFCSFTSTRRERWGGSRGQSQHEAHKKKLLYLRSLT